MGNKYESDKRENRAEKRSERRRVMEEVAQEVLAEDHIRLHDCGRFHRPSEPCPGT